MSYAICLNQNTPNFNINNLSLNGFNIYSDVDGFTTPIYQNISYLQLFQFPIGNCPFIATLLPPGTTQIIVIDQCNPNLNVAAAIFSPTNITAGELTIECCYAIIDIPQSPPPAFCETCPLIFDVFPTTNIGILTAGNLTSTCGPVTDYVIGWYLNGDYSSPAITSGFGSSFLPYQQLHPLTGNSSVPSLAGNYEGIIHDININGVIYSSVSGSANGLPIPFESCFDTVIVEPLQCDNGPFQGIAKYTHQINFNSQAVGTTSAPVSLTYALDPTTKYFAYFFDTYYVSDEIEIKWKSGDASVTTNPSLYSQPIYLEKLKRGGDIPYNYNALPATTPYLINSPSSVFNSVWPKESPTIYGTGFQSLNGFQRVLTLTSLETSSNPLAPDLLEITITPNSTNNNTQWRAAFQCLDDFDCTLCSFSDWPNSLPKIFNLHLQKQYGCSAQRLSINNTSCTNNSDLWGSGNPLLSLTGSLIGGLDYTNNSGFILPAGGGYVALHDAGVCYPVNNHIANCGSPSTGTITLNKIPGQVQLIFNLYSDFLHYKNSLFTEYTNMWPSSPLSPVSCSPGSTTPYYNFFTLKVPVQLNSSANCGDNSSEYTFCFHINDYFNIQYVNDNNPNASTWSITIPQTPIVNCYPILNCNNCNSQIDSYLQFYNLNVQDLSTFSFTTIVGAKYINPFSNINYVSSQATLAESGSVCLSTVIQNQFPWYSTFTMPFISSPSSPTGWVNLTSLSSSLPCNFNEYPIQAPSFYDQGWAYKAGIFGIQVHFPTLTSSFNYSLSTNDFELYSLTNVTSTGSIDRAFTCPDISGSLIYSYIGGVATVYSASYFAGGVAPTLTIDP